MSYRPRRRYHQTAGAEGIPSIVKLLMLRMLVPLGGHQEFVGRRELQNDELARLLGLGDWVACEYEEGDPISGKSKLKACLAVQTHA